MNFESNSINNKQIFNFTSKGYESIYGIKNDDYEQYSQYENNNEAFVIPDKIMTKIKNLDESIIDDGFKITTDHQKKALTLICRTLLTSAFNQTIKSENSINLNHEELRKYFDYVCNYICEPSYPTKESENLWNHHYFNSSMKSKVFLSNHSKKLPIRYVNKITHKNILYEAVTLVNKPSFLYYDKEIQDYDFTPFIVTETNKILPNNKNGIGYLPHEFDSEFDVFKMTDEVTSLDKFDLYKQIYTILGYFLSNNFYRKLFSVIILFSYYQDEYVSTPYLYLVGDSNTGKTMMGEIFYSFGYRCAKCVEPSIASLYRMQGTIEEGQVTLVLDEVNDKLNDKSSIRQILKSGYKKGDKITRCRPDDYNIVENLNSFGFKILIGERLPTKDSKGLLDRVFVIRTRHEQHFETLDISQIMRTSINENLKKHINHLRNKLLLYKLRHHGESIHEFKIYGKEMPEQDHQSPIDEFEEVINMKNNRLLTNRELELITPFLMFIDGLVSSNFKENVNILRDEIIPVFNELLNGRIENKEKGSLEGEIVELIKEEFFSDTRSSNREIHIMTKFKFLKEELIHRTNGVRKGEHAFETSEYGYISEKQISEILIQFGFKRHRKRDGPYYSIKRKDFEILSDKYTSHGKNYRFIHDIFVKDRLTNNYIKIENLVS